MYTLILLAHILIGIVMTASAFGTFLAAHGKRRSNVYALMIGSFGATILSGVGLLAMGAGIGRICIGMTASTLAVLLVRNYYLKRLATSTTV